MDPILPTMTFATIVSLIADFVSHRGAEESTDFDSFMEWMQVQRHDEIRGLLQAHSKTTISIKAILSESHQQILERLTSLDRTISAVASSIPAYQHIAQLAHPANTLSEQANSVLEQLYDAAASGIIERKLLDGITLPFLDGKHGQVEYKQPQFTEDDLLTLVDLGLLDLRHSDGGDRVFNFKRTAAALVEQRRGT